MKAAPELGGTGLEGAGPVCGADAPSHLWWWDGSRQRLSPCIPASTPCPSLAFAWNDSSLLPKPAFSMGVTEWHLIAQPVVLTSPMNGALPRQETRGPNLGNGSDAASMGAAEQQAFRGGSLILGKLPCICCKETRWHFSRVPGIFQCPLPTWKH